MFALAATTDYVDGYLARNWQQQSLFGRWLDPVADKLLVASAVVMLVGFDRAPLLPSLVIMLREITVSGLREYMAEVSVGLPVSRLAKWKTAVQMTAIGFLLVGGAGPGLAAGRGDRLVGAVARGHPDPGHRLGLSAGRPAPHAAGPPRRQLPSRAPSAPELSLLSVRPMRIRYFAWLKHRVGCAEETLELPPEVASVAALKALLGRPPRRLRRGAGQPGRGALRRQPGVRARGRAAAGRGRGRVLPAGDGG